MKTAFYAAALGAALLLTASTARVYAEDRDCTVDLKSLCAGVTAGEGRVQACIQSHISELSVGCSSRLSKAAWVLSECHADVQHFCPDAKYGSIADCMRPHLARSATSAGEQWRSSPPPPPISNARRERWLASGGASADLISAKQAARQEAQSPKSRGS